MKKFIFPIFIALFSGVAFGAKEPNCVQPGQLKDIPDGQQIGNGHHYIKSDDYLEEAPRYLKCGQDDTYDMTYCHHGTIVVDKERNVYKCTEQNEWEKVEKISTCVEQLDYYVTPGFKNNYRQAKKRKDPAVLFYTQTQGKHLSNYCTHNIDLVQKKEDECIKQEKFNDGVCNQLTTMFNNILSKQKTNSDGVTADSEQMTISGTQAEACKYSGGDDYRNGKCICDADKYLEEYKPENAPEYSICRCIKGYHRDGTPDENGKYPATGKCVDAGDFETHEEFDSAAWRRDTENAYKHERDNAQSLANKSITAGSTLLTGEGAMKAAQALAEQKADRDAEIEMAEWISKMGCEYGNSQQVNLGKEETLPGGNELTQYYTEYKQLADKLKATKAALNLRPGIETEVLYDRAETGLYQYANAERQSGGFTSLSRALMNPEGTDAEQWNAQKAEVAQNLQTGTLLTAGGLATGAIGNYFVNRNHKPLELKRKFKEIKTKLENDYPEIFTVPVISTPEPEPEPTPEPVVAPTEEIHLELPPVYGPGFKYGDYELENKGKQALDEAINLISQALTAQGVENTRIKIHVIGHSDRDRVKPNKRYKDNYDLSRKRATKVLDYLRDGLTNKNLDSRIDFDYSNIEGRGPDECVKGEDPQKCRRVDIEVTDITNYQQQ